MSKTRLTDRWRFLALIAVLSAVVVVAVVVLTKGVSADEWNHGVSVGDVHPMSAVCDAKGASEVAKASLVAGNHEAGNVEFMRQAHVEPIHCYYWGFSVSMKVEEITYVGASNGVHVYVIDFGGGMYGVMTGTHSADPDPGPGLAGFQV